MPCRVCLVITAAGRYRLIEPCFADLTAGDAGEFFRAALEREHFGQECGIEGAVLARREAPGWRAIAGSEPELLGRLLSAARGEAAHPVGEGLQVLRDHTAPRRVAAARALAADEDGD